MRQTLTQKTIDKEIRKHKTGTVFIHDTDVPGFYLRIQRTSKGAIRATFFVRYGGRGRRQTVKLGLYGAGFTADDARKAARPVVGDKDKGLDPAADRKEKRGMATFGEWADEYLKEVKLRKKSHREDERFLKLAKKRWKTRPLDKIKTDDVRKWFQSIAAEKREVGKGTGVFVAKKITANRALASLRACLQAAWRNDRMPSNPAMKVRPLPENTPRATTLTDEQLHALVKAVEALPDPHFKLAFTLLLTTGARLSEVLHAKWEDFDLDAANWRIPSPKAGRPQVVPLPAKTVALLRNTEHADMLAVPGAKPGKPRFDLRAPWDTLRAAAAIPGVHIHDLRRDFGLRVSKAAGLHVASKLLRHSDVRVTERVYAPLGLEDLRKATE